MRNKLIFNWIRLGIAAGVIAAVVYPVLILTTPPFKILVILVPLFGVSLSIASGGLYYFLSLHKKTVTAQIALASNIVAGTLVNLMLFAQIAVNRYLRQLLSGEVIQSDEEQIKLIWSIVDRVQLGIDVLWDVYLAAGIFFFAIAMFKHPKLGKLFFFSGLLIAFALAGANLYYFPIPPAESGFYDLGPLAGIWYLMITIKIIFTYKWIKVKTINAKD